MSGQVCPLKPPGAVSSITWSSNASRKVTSSWPAGPTWLISKSQPRSPIKTSQPAKFQQEKHLKQLTILANLRFLKTKKIHSNQTLHTNKNHCWWQFRWLILSPENVSPTHQPKRTARLFKFHTTELHQEQGQSYNERITVSHAFFLKEKVSSAS